MDPRYQLIAKTRAVIACIRRCKAAQPCQACPWRGLRVPAGGCPVTPIRVHIAADFGSVDPWEGRGD